MNLFIYNLFFVYGRHSYTRSLNRRHTEMEEYMFTSVLMDEGSHRNFLF